MKTYRSDKKLKCDHFQQQNAQGAMHQEVLEKGLLQS